jgi:hypothetical protein
MVRFLVMVTKARAGKWWLWCCRVGRVSRSAEVASVGLGPRKNGGMGNNFYTACKVFVVMPKREKFSKF